MNPLPVKAWTEEPVGIVAKTRAGQPEGTVEFPLRVTDFSTGKTLTEVSWTPYKAAYLSSVETSEAGSSINFLGFPIGAVGSVASARWMNMEPATLETQPIPYIDDRLMSMLRMTRTIAFVSNAPIVWLFNDQGHLIAKKSLDRGESKTSPANVDMWAFCESHNSFAVSCAGATTVGFGDIFRSRFYIGNLSGAGIVESGPVAGIIPPSGKKDEWTLVFVDGRISTFTLTKRNTYRKTVDHVPFHVELVGEVGIYDSVEHALYVPTADARLAWISFTHKGRPAIHYAKSPKPVIGTLTTFDGSRWIADAVPENSIGPAHIQWFYKLPNGEPRYRFTSVLKAGERFIGLTGQRQQSRLN